MIAVFLAEGFEETEALTTVDVLRRAGLDAVTIGVGHQTVTGAHGISVLADRNDKDWNDEELEGVVLPGGMPGTLHLTDSDAVSRALDYAVNKGLLIGAICAAPSILGQKGLLKGRRATCFPGFEDELEGAELVSDPVAVDGHYITAKGMGVTIPFALAIVRTFTSPEEAVRLERSLQCR